jgi:hypothetical protein
MNRLNESFGYVASIGGFTVLVRTRLSDDKTEPTTTSGSACGAD